MEQWAGLLLNIHPSGPVSIVIGTRNVLPSPDSSLDDNTLTSVSSRLWAETGKEQFSGPFC